MIAFEISIRKVESFFSVNKKQGVKKLEVSS